MADEEEQVAQPTPGVRFEATVHAGERQRTMDAYAALDLDRLPDADEQVRVLITMQEAARLVQLGYEVRLLASRAIAPLDAALVADDESADTWLAERVDALDQAGIERQGEG